jgi:hypothetical protein
MADGDALDVMMGRIRTTWQEFEAIPDRANQGYQTGLRWLDDHSDTLGDTLTSSLHSSLKSLLEAILKAWNWMHDSVKDGIVDFVDGYQLLQQMTPWRDLWLVVSNQAKEAGKRLENPHDRLDQYWQGKAYDKYCTVIDPQNTAAQRVGDLAKGLSESLTSMISAGTAAGYAILVFLLAAVVAFGMAILGLAGVVTAPAGLTALGTAVGAVGAYKYAFTVFGNAQAAESSKLAGQAADPTGFAAGPAWPRSSVPTDVDPKDPVVWIPQPPPVAPAPAP